MRAACRPPTHPRSPPPLRRRHVCVAGCRQRQIVGLPALARGDLRERLQPPQEDTALSPAELHAFLLELLEQQRELELSDGRGGGAERGFATLDDDAAQQGFARAAAGSGRAQLAAQAGAAGWASAVSMASERSSGRWGHALYPTGRLSSAGGPRVSLGASGLDVAAGGGHVHAQQQPCGFPPAFGHARPSTAPVLGGTLHGPGSRAAHADYGLKAKQVRGGY